MVGLYVGLVRRSAGGVYILGGGLFWDEGFSGLGSLRGMWGLSWVMVLSVPAFCGVWWVGGVTSIRSHFPPFSKSKVDANKHTDRHRPIVS